MNIFNKLESLEKEASDFGFAWPDENTIIKQIINECKEVQKELEQISSVNYKLQEEIGDLLHAAFSLCIFCKFDPEQTLLASINKFEKRFLAVKQLAINLGFNDLNGLPFDKLMEFWDKAKAEV